MAKDKYDKCDICNGVIRIGDWPICGGDSTKHVSCRPARHDFEPITIYRDKNGQIRIPGNSKRKPPKGWQRVELTTRREAEKISAEMNATDRRKWNSLREREAVFFEQNFAKNRAETEDLRRNIDDPKVREYIDIAIRESDKRDYDSKRYDPGIYFGVLE